MYVCISYKEELISYVGDDNEVISLEECLDETFKEDTAGPIVCPNCSLLKTLFCEINPGKEYLDIEDFK